MKSVRLYEQRPTEIPSNTATFSGYLQLYHLDECNGEATPQSKVQTIPLALTSTVNGASLVFEGTPLRWEHHKSNCPLTNHSNGMHFGIVCNNHGIDRSFIWIRELDASELEKTVATSFELEGGSTTIPLEKCTGTVTIHAESKGHIYYVKRVYFSITADAYREWIKSL